MCNAATNSAVQVIRRGMYTSLPQALRQIVALNKVFVCVEGADVCPSADQRDNACTSANSRRLTSARFLTDATVVKSAIVLYEESGGQGTADASTIAQVLESTGGSAAAGASVDQLVTELTNVVTSKLQATAAAGDNGEDSVLIKNIQAEAASQGETELATVTGTVTVSASIGADIAPTAAADSSSNDSIAYALMAVVVVLVLGTLGAVIVSRRRADRQVMNQRAAASTSRPEELELTAIAV